MFLCSLELEVLGNLFGLSKHKYKISASTDYAWLQLSLIHSSQPSCRCVYLCHLRRVIICYNHALTNALGCLNDLAVSLLRF